MPRYRSCGSNYYDRPFKKHCSFITNRKCYRDDEVKIVHKDDDDTYIRYDRRDGKTYYRKN